MMAVSNAGKIIVEEAYAQGKMAQSASWQEGKCLPRGITPSDIDLVFDNGGASILVELSRFSMWENVSVGQRKTYEGLLWNSERCAVVCQHAVTGRMIDTRMDIIAFQPMVFDESAIWVCPVIKGNDKWQNFVFSWYENFSRVRSVLIARAKGEIWPK